ncbi:MAG: sigma-70 family RNA polymerase sigma factor [Clostridiales bacterium]|nr:sigma-70 family RNA polymerase sigma factor [Clostridiales bacterium]
MLGFYLTMLETAEEKSKFEELYILYRQDMFKMAMSILHTEHAAEDAVHDAFLSLVNNLSKIAEINCPQTHAYLIIIVKNAALKIFNKGKRDFAEDIDEQYDIASDISVENEAINNVDVELLKKILFKLPQEQYEILFLEQKMGLSLLEISKTMNITYECAKKRLQRAKAKLKQEVLICGN